MAALLLPACARRFNDAVPSRTTDDRFSSSVGWRGLAVVDTKKHCLNDQVTVIIQTDPSLRPVTGVLKFTGSYYGCHSKVPLRIRVPRSFRRNPCRRAGCRNPLRQRRRPLRRSRARSHCRRLHVRRQEALLTGQTNGAGIFSFIAVQPDLYQVVIEAPGFAKRQIGNVKVEPVQDTSLGVIKMELQSSLSPSK